MKNKILNKFKVLALFLVLFSTLYSCKKCKEGVLEVKIAHYLGMEYSMEYYAYYVKDSDFPPNTVVEVTDESKYFFSYTRGSKDYRAFVYYWPDKSAKDLGYTKSKNYHYLENLDFTFYSDEGSAYPGPKGYWKDQVNFPGPFPSGTGNGAADNSGSGSSCINGTWYSPACGDSRGVVWKFNSNGTGSFSNKDCNGICNPIVFTFSYSISGGTCNVTYDAVQPYVTCTGYPDTRPQKPNDESFTFSCSSTQLTVNSGNGSNVFTK